MKKKICNACLRYVPIDVFALAPGSGGQVDLVKRIMELDITGNWNYTLQLLLHETMEAAYMLHGLRMTRPQRYSSSEVSVIHMTHEKFNLATQDAADFLETALPEVQAFHREYHKKRATR